MIRLVATLFSRTVMAYHLQKKILFITILLTILKSTHQQKETVCAGVEDGNFVRNSASCRSYYYCVEGKPVANNCPTDLYFNAAQQTCDVQDRVDCTQCSPFGVQQIPHPHDCSKYYLCVSGIRTMRVCGSGLYFDPRIGDCNLQRFVDCVATPDLTTVCTQFASYGFVVIGDRNDCSRYYFCLNGMAYPEKCAPNLYFNPDVGYCELPAAYNYCQGPGEIVIPPPYTTTTTSTTTMTTTTVNATTTTAATTKSGATTTTTRGGRIVLYKSLCRLNRTFAAIYTCKTF